MYYLEKTWNTVVKTFSFEYRQAKKERKHFFFNFKQIKLIELRNKLLQTSNGNEKNEISYFNFLHYKTNYVF